MGAMKVNGQGDLAQTLCAERFDPVLILHTIYKIDPVFSHIYNSFRYAA